MRTAGPLRSIVILCCQPLLFINGVLLLSENSLFSLVTFASLYVLSVSNSVLSLIMSEAEVLTTEDLRNRMFEVLKKRGLIDVLKVGKQTTVPHIEDVI